MRRLYLSALVIILLLSGLTGGRATAAEATFTEGLHLYHTGHYAEALRIFRTLHRHQPSGTGKFQYFMALSEDHQGLEHQALIDLEGAIHTNPGLTFTNNPAHVRSMHTRLMHRVIEEQSPVPPPHPVSFPGESPRPSSHLGLLLVFVAIGGVLIYLALRRMSQKRERSGTRDKEEMEETAGRLMKAVDKLLDDKTYFLLDHPNKKEALEASFRPLDSAYRNVLNILREPETPQTDWSERRNRFEAALAPVDAAILNIRNLLDEKAEPALSSTAGTLPPPGQETGQAAPPEPPPIGGDRCVFCGRDAREGRTVPLERQGKVAYARVCPTCLAEMEQNYQKTGAYQPPSSFYTGGVPYMGGGLSFGDLMLLDWMTHEGHHDTPPVSMPESHPQGDWSGGGVSDREDRERGGLEGGDRS